MPPDPAPDRAFDDAARAHYREAAATLPPALQGRLRAARRAAFAAPSAASAWRLAMPLAAMATAVLALGVGLRMQAPPVPPAATGAGTVPTHPAIPSAAPSGDAEGSLLTLEDDPDFYLWLGAGEADPMLDPSSEDCCDEPS
ncbi:MAG TPA: hypothetical protein VNI56_01525 [Xanthomonadaceae bacterium]|nr:hypothetical protein [Xanthomonadaceae bacterium]